MNTHSKLIANYYDKQSMIEWERLEQRHRMEFALTMHMLETYLPPPPAKVLDCGGGPGRYAIELAQRGYQVTLFDLSTGNLRLAREKAGEAGVELAGYEQGNATDLRRFPSEAFDAVLLMGPLYHLLEYAERHQALLEAKRVLKPGGPLFAAFINRYAAHFDFARREPGWLLEQDELSEMILTSGRLPPRQTGADEFIAYLTHPDEVEPLCLSAGLEVIKVLGVDIWANLIEERKEPLSGEVAKKWFDLNERTATDACVQGCAQHLLAIAEKPRWRAVLRQIAIVLDQVGLSYTLVGGASAALHGVPVPVKDLDIEMGAEGVYRFQEMFSQYVIEPVRLCESELYRSHFGRLDFEGITVEIMGDLHRREGQVWVPTYVNHREVIDLEGVPVQASWLEEETLAYIRRGRLERAALCLERCDHQRITALIRDQKNSDS